MTTSNQQDPLGYDTPPPPLPRGSRAKAWAILKEIAPELEHLEPRSINEQAPPRPLSDGVFLSLAACLTDPVKKAIITAIIEELILPIIDKRIAAILTDDKE